jgi:hypothetical protein
LESAREEGKLKVGDWHLAQLLIHFQEVLELRDLLILRAKDVANESYFPPAWVGRSGILFKLGYPELSAGDAYKAVRLCDAGLCYNSELGTTVRLGVGMLVMLQDPRAVGPQNLSSGLIVGR